MRFTALVPTLCILVAAQNLASEEAAPPPQTESTVEETVAAESKADSVAEEGDVIVITPMRRPTSAERTPVRVDLITQDELQRRGNPSRLRDVIGSRSGVFIQGNGGLYGATTMRLRGTRNGDTRVLKDGLPVFDSTSIEGTMDFSRVNTAGLEQAEILYGSQSGLYGSGAIAGVLNLQGARPTYTQKNSVLLEGGMYNSQRIEGVFTGPISQEIGYAFTVHGSRSDGISTRYDNSDLNTPLGEPGSAEKDGHDQTLASLRLEWSPHDDVLTYLSAEHQFSRFAYDGFGSNAFDDENSRSRAHDWRLSSGAEMVISNDLTLSADALVTINRRTERGESAASRRYFNGRVLYGQVNANYVYDERTTIDVGLDLEQQQYYTQPGSERASNLGTWATVEVQEDDYLLGLTARHDLHSREGGATTFRANSAWYFWDQRVKTFASVGTAYRAPTLYQLYNSFAGNEDLEAQRTIGYEGGISVKPLPWITVDATWYKTDYRETIDYVGSSYTNRSGNIEVTGYEFRVTANPEDAPWRVTAYMNPQQEKNLPKVPEVLAGVETTYDWSTSWLTLGVRHIGQQRFMSFGSEVFVEAYTVAYGAAGYRPCDNTEIFIRLENIGDEDYIENAGFTTLGPSIWAGIKATF
jgi:vitamin B12 transporter